MLETEGGASADERSCWRQDRRRIRKGFADKPGRSDRGGAPRRSFARPRPLGGRTHQHPHAVCWRREDHSPEDPGPSVAGETTGLTGRNPTSRPALVVTDRGYDSKKYRGRLRQRGIPCHIARRQTGLGVEQVAQVPIDGRPSRFHHIETERIAVPLVSILKIFEIVDAGMWNVGMLMPRSVFV
jgi:hypothetical protein